MSIVFEIRFKFEFLKSRLSGSDVVSLFIVVLVKLVVRVAEALRHLVVTTSVDVLHLFTVALLAFLIAIVAVKSLAEMDKQLNFVPLKAMEEGTFQSL